MKKLIALLIAGLMLTSTSAPASIILNNVLVDTPSLAHDATFQQDLQGLKIQGLVGQAIIGLATTPAEVSFQDGTQAVGSITVADYSLLSVSAATNSVTVSLNTGLTGASISVPGFTLREGIDWAVLGTASGTASSIQAAFAKVSFLQVSRTGAVVSLTAPLGLSYNSTPLSTTAPSSLTVAHPTFIGGRNNATITINGAILTQGTQWSAGGSNNAAASSMASAINTALGSTLSATPASAVISLLSNTNGSVFNYKLAASVASITVSGPLMTGGTDADISVGSPVIRIPSHGLSLGEAAVFGSPDFADFTDGATYFAIPVDQNHLKLATSKSNALAGSAVSVTAVPPHLVANTATLTAAAVSGAPSLKWQSSADGASWSDLSISSLPSTVVTAGPNQAAWNFGTPSYRYIRANVVGPVTGGIGLKLSLRGTDSLSEQFPSDILLGSIAGATGTPVPPDVVTGVGTAGTITKWTASGVVGDSSLSETMTDVTINKNLVVNSNMSLVDPNSDGFSESFTSYGAVPTIQMSAANGTEGSPSDTLDGDDLGQILFRGYQGAFIGSRAHIQGRAVGDWTPSNRGEAVWIGATKENTNTKIPNVVIVSGDAVTIKANTPLLMSGSDGYLLSESTVTAASIISQGKLEMSMGVISTGPGANNVEGDERGTGATDLQTYRVVSTNVASGSYATIGGGATNTASGPISVVSGGTENTASMGAATVSGGFGNMASGNFSTVSGGHINTAADEKAAVGGGEDNHATGQWSFVGGGGSNTANNNYATVGGGASNTASGGASTVIGGLSNTANGDYSIAAGRRAKAVHQGATVITDSTDADFSSTADDQLSVRAGGGANFTIPYSTFTGNVRANAFTGDGSALTGISASIPGVTNTRMLQDSGPVDSVDWESRALFDGSDILSLHWNNRTLNNEVASTVLDWSGSGVLIKDTASNVGLTVRGSNPQTSSAIRAEIGTGGPHTDMYANDAFNGGIEFNDSTFPRFTINAYMSGSPPSGDLLTIKNYQNVTSILSLTGDGALTVSGTVSVGGGSNIVYRCTGSTGGTFDGTLSIVQNTGACPSGTWVATSLKVN